MKKILFTVTFMLAFAWAACAQILKPVTWSYAAKRLPGNQAMLLLRATIDEGWHIYSQTVANGGPVKTTIQFNAAKTYTVIGKPIEPKPITEYEKDFDMKVSYFEKQVIFQQKIKLKDAGATTIKGSIEFMACNNKQCLPPETVEFSIQVN